MLGVTAEYPLTPLQQGMLFHHLLEPDGGVDIEQLVFTLPERVDAVALRDAWSRVTTLHEALRTSFLWDDGERAVQQVHPSVPMSWSEVDWRDVAENVDERLRLFLEQDRRRAFDLRSAPLQRFTLARVADDEYRLVWTFHHIILDGRSFTILLKEVFGLYDTQRFGRTSTPLVEPPPFREHVAWITERDAAADEPVWRERLKGFAAPTPLPANLGGADDQEFRRSGRQGDAERRLTAETTSALAKLAEQVGVTMNTVLQGAWAILLSRHARDPDVVFGATRAGRRGTVAGAAQMVGLLINTVPVRVHVDARAQLGSWLAALRADWVSLRPVEHSPLSMVQSWSDVPAGTPLFESLVVFENYNLETALREQGGAWSNRRVRLHEQTNYPMILAVYGGCELTLKLDYDRDRVEDATAARVLAQLATLLDGMSDAAESLVGDLPWLESNERELILYEWNRTAREYPRDQTISERFAEFVTATPDAIAVVHGERTLTYRQLDARANQLARRLRRLGVDRDVAVGLCISRSLEMVVGALGILKAGGAYVTLDPDYPAQRLAFMLADTAARVVVTEQALLPLFDDDAITRLSLDSEWESIAREYDTPLDEVATAECLAYIIFTSGSTGTPKGVMALHRGVMRLVCNADYMHFGAEEVFLSFAPLNFDASTLEVWGALLNGAKLVVFPTHHPAVEELAEVIASQGVTTLWLTAALFHQVVDADVEALRPLRQLLAGGDVLSPSHVRRVRELLPHVTLINGYGPTENTTFTCCYTVPSPGKLPVTVPIGRPISNTTVYLLDDAMQPVPIGVAGRLYTGGDGVARGYLNRAELTAERFIADSFATDPHARLYDTGDLARWRADGTIDFIGRVDQQLKVRGFRVEPGEIEAVLLQQSGVRECTVIAREDTPGNKRLVAYVVPTEPGEAFNAETLRNTARRYLPSYMIPSAFVALEQMPLTQSGKIDRKLLPPPTDLLPVTGAETAAPRTAVETILAEVWSQVLGLPSVGVHDDFFALGGDSILMIRIVSLARKHGLVLSPRDMFKHPTVAELAPFTTAVEQPTSTSATPLATIDAAALAALGLRESDVEDVYPLSPIQSGLLFHTLSDSGKGEYHIQVRFAAHGALRVDALRAAWSELIRRHPILRTAFVWESVPAPLQFVLKDAALPFFEEDWRDQSDPASAAQLNAWLAADEQAGFELARAPLTRVRVIRTAEDRYEIVWSFHHLLLDGWSAHAVLRELGTLYDARVAETPVRLETLRPYRDYIAELAAGNPAAESFWRARLAGFEAPTPFRIDRPPGESERGFAQEQRVLSAERWSALQTFVRAHRLTVNTVVQGAWALVLSRYSGERDVVFGATVTTRPTRLDGADKMVGLFLNTLPIRVQVEPKALSEEWLCALQLEQAEMSAHENTPLVDIQRWSDVARGAPLFESIVVFENYPGANPFSGSTREVTFGALEFIERTHYPLTLVVVPGETLVIRASYDAGRFDADTIGRVLGHLERVIDELIASSRSLEEIALMDDVERRLVVQEWNTTARDYPPDALLHDLIAATAGKRPKAVALAFRDEQLTYGQLEANANTLARALARRGVQPGVIVGVLMERSLDLVVALLAVLKAGGAYVPLDPEYPAERLRYMMEDARCKVILSQQRVADSIAAGVPTDARLFCVDQDWAQIVMEATDLHEVEPATADDLAYMIYTSGSTGRPKGAMNRHRGIVNRLLWMQDEYTLTDADVVLQKTPASFDVSVWEFFWPLMAGAKLVLAEPGGHRDPAYLNRVIREHGVTVMHFVPSMLRAFLDGSASTSDSTLRDVMCSGEALPYDLQQRFFSAYPRTRLNNLYGPTEAAVDVTYWECRRGDARQVVPIGRPVANTQIYVLDAALAPVPIGVPGELYIGGVQVGAGYYGRPELTDERFVPDPFGSADPRARLYRTGDRARWLSDGTLEYLGRLDSQIKLRGFRIEIGEIETALTSLDTVRECAVLLRTDPGAEPRLVAYYVPVANSAPSTFELRSRLSETLPGHMVPTVFVALDALPLSPSGKLDRRALPVPVLERGESADGYVAPFTPAEDTLARIWAHVLRLERVGMHDNFYELGGDSILSIQIAARARDAGLPVTVAALVRHATVADLAASLTGMTETPSRVHRLSLAQTAPLTPIQRWFFELDLPQRSHWNQTFLFRTDVVLDDRALRLAVEELISHHDVLRSRFSLENGEWTQRVVMVDRAHNPLWIEDLSGASYDDAANFIAATNAKAGASLDIENGPLLRVVYYNLGEARGGRLLMAIHHLVVDGVSWRILREDLEAAYQSALANKAAQLPAKTASYQQWAESLAEYTAGGAFACEREHWMRTSRLPLERIPTRSHDAGENTVADVGSIVVSLDERETSDLMQRVPSVYATQINDALVCALADALTEFAGSGALLVDLEGHGREDIGAHLDLTRTVGWFTTIFPIRVQLGASGDVGARLKEVKECLRAVPRRGIGFGALKYLADDSELVERAAADVLFNYLGQFDQLVADSSLFTFASENEGPWLSPQSRRRYLLEINALVLNGRLEFRWAFPKKLQDEVRIRRVADAMLESLRAIIAHCKSAHAGGRTPSDFPLVALTQEQVDRIVGDGRAVEEIAPLAPMQSLFLATSAGGNDVGFEQWRFEIDASLDADAMRRAWHLAASRQQILRTSFESKGLSSPVQVIRRQVELPFIEHDWRTFDPATQARKMDDLLAVDRARGFRVDEAPLTRIALVRTGERAWTLVWSTHHLLLDRWSWPIVLQEIGFAYQALRDGRKVELPPATPWRRYLAWLADRDASATEAFWRGVLAGFEPAHLPALNGVGGDGGEERLDLSAEETMGLTSMARERRVTVNALISTAWGFWVSRATDRTDVVLGLAVSGRPEEIHGIDRLVGMCINNVPIRLTFHARDSVSDVIRRFVERQNAAAAHAHATVTDLQTWSGLPWHERLFDTLLVFQQGTSDEASNWLGETEAGSSRRSGRQAAVRMLHGNTQTAYPLAVVVSSGERLVLRLAYQGRALSAAGAREVLTELKTILLALPELGDAPVSEVLSMISRPGIAARAVTARGPLARPTTDTEWVVSRIWAELLGRDEVGIDENFFDLGGQSLVATQIMSRVRDAFRLELRVSLLFEQPTVERFSRALIEREATPGQVERIARITRNVEEMTLWESREVAVNA